MLLLAFSRRGVEQEETFEEFDATERTLRSSEGREENRSRNLLLLLDAFCLHHEQWRGDSHIRILPCPTLAQNEALLTI